MKSARKEQILDRLPSWRVKHISDRTLVVMLALVVGAFAGLAAVLLKFLIASIAGFLTAKMRVAQGNILYLVFPVIGILLAGLYVRYFVKDNISHGVTRVLYAIALKKEQTETSQHLLVACGFIGDHRVRRFGRS